jgi:nucleoid-associated protein YgaU
MRKDVKLGLAIGAILLAVIIVWAAVPRHAKKTVVLLPPATDTTQQPDQSTPSHSSDANTPAPGDTHNGSTPAQTPAPDVTANAGGAGSSGTPPKDSTDSKNAAPDWAALLAASNVQDIHAMMGQSHATGVTPAVDHPDVPANDVETTADHDHGGMTFDSGEPTTRPTASVSSATPRTHTVQSGETLAAIAKSVYGKSGMYIAIEKANPNINPNRLKVGTVLTLPSANTESSSSSSSSSTDSITPTRHSHASAALDSTTEYRVQPGDSLHKIAVKLYGNAARSDELYTSNKEVIGDDPAKLKVGEVLKLPEPPTATASR